MFYFTRGLWSVDLIFIKICPMSRYLRQIITFVMFWFTVMRRNFQVGNRSSWKRFGKIWKYQSDQARVQKSFVLQTRSQERNGPRKIVRLLSDKLPDYKRSVSSDEGIGLGISGLNVPSKELKCLTYPVPIWTVMISGSIRSSKIYLNCSELIKLWHSEVKSLTLTKWSYDGHFVGLSRIERDQSEPISLIFTQVTASQSSGVQKTKFREKHILKFFSCFHSKFFFIFSFTTSLHSHQKWFWREFYPTWQLEFTNFPIEAGLEIL